jgi:hypothetical protein
MARGRESEEVDPCPFWKEKLAPYSKLKPAGKIEPIHRSKSMS